MLLCPCVPTDASQSQNVTQKETGEKVDAQNDMHKTQQIPEEENKAREDARPSKEGEAGNGNPDEGEQGMRDEQRQPEIGSNFRQEQQAPTAKAPGEKNRTASGQGRVFPTPQALPKPGDTKPITTPSVANLKAVMTTRRPRTSGNTTLHSEGKPRSANVSHSEHSSNTTSQSHVSSGISGHKEADDNSVEHHFPPKGFKTQTKPNATNLRYKSHLRSQAVDPGNNSLVNLLRCPPCSGVALSSTSNAFLHSVVHCGMCVKAVLL